MNKPMKKLTIKAVYEDDLPAMLKNLDMWRPFLRGELYGPCGNKITEENLIGFKRIDGKIRALCSLYRGDI